MFLEKQVLISSLTNIIFWIEKKERKGKKNMTPTVHFRLSLARSLTLSGKKLGITATEFYFYF